MQEQLNDDNIMSMFDNMDLKDHIDDKKKLAQRLQEDKEFDSRFRQSEAELYAMKTNQDPPESEFNNDDPLLQEARAISEKLHSMSFSENSESPETVEDMENTDSVEKNEITENLENTNTLESESLDLGKLGIGKLVIVNHGQLTINF